MTTQVMIRHDGATHDAQLKIQICGQEGKPLDYAVPRFLKEGESAICFIWSHQQLHIEEVLPVGQSDQPAGGAD